MSQRHLLRGACRVLSESLVGSKHGSSGPFMRSIAQRLQDGPALSGGLAQCPLMMRSLRQGCVQVSAFPSTVPMGFAASSPSVVGPLSVLGSVAQHRGVSSTDAAEEGDGEDARSLLRRTTGDDPPDYETRRGQDAGRRLGVSGGPRGGGAGRDAGSGGPRDEVSETLELVASARQLYTKRDPSGARSAAALPALPPELREAMYGAGGVWDRVLVDVRRSSRPLGRKEGKEEQYTAVVASGNMKGLLGLGTGIAETAQLAVARAHLDSMTRLASVPLYRGHTIYHSVKHNFHRLQMQIEPRPEGWGLTCSDLLYELCNVVGIRNITIKLRGGRTNKFFVAQCFQEALLSQSTPHDGVEASGMYIREVFRRQKLPGGLVRGVDVM